jgi:hypothetical protein
VVARLVESIFRNIEFRTKKLYIENRNGSALFLLHPWPFYMTSWSLTVLLLHLWLMALLVIYYYNFKNTFYCASNTVTANPNTASKTDCELPLNQEHVQQPQQQQQQQQQDTKTPWFIKFMIKISWLLYNIVAISAIVVTVCYFSYVFFAQMKPDPDILMQIGDFHRHGLNSLVVIIDIIIVSYPVFILHFVYTVVFGYVYALATFIYWFLDPAENIIYFTLDYSKPMTISIFYLFLSFLTFVLQFMHFSVYSLKLYLRNKLCK